MLISFLFTIILIVLLNGTISSQRKKWVLTALVFYFVVTMIDFYWLACVLERPFHFTDPTDYYTRTLGIPFNGIFKFEENFTNSFYFIVNWSYNHFYDNPYVISFLIKINNILVILVSYLFLTKRLPNFSKTDLLLLFNPYLIVTIIRNVRDPYIILFVAMILGGLNMLRGVKSNIWLVIIGVALLFITREVLLLAVLLVLLIRFIKKKKKRAYFIIPIVLVGLWFSKEMIFSRIVMQAVSAMEFVHEDTSEIAPLLNQQFSLSSLILIVKRFGIGLVALLFTPHPVNYYQDWMADYGYLGNCGIYTGFDQILICLGAAFCYIFIIPRMFWYIRNCGRINNELFMFIVFFILLYVVAYLGITDIRNRHFIFFYLLIAIIYKESELGHRIKLAPIDNILSIFIFTGIFLLSTI